MNRQFKMDRLPRLKIAPPNALSPGVPLPPPLPVNGTEFVPADASSPSSPSAPVAELPVKTQFDSTTVAPASTKIAPPLVLFPPRRINPFRVREALDSTRKMRSPPPV